MSDVRVLIVDDHPVVRVGLRAMLAEQPGIVVVGEASDADDAIRAATFLGPDVVVMDLELGAGPDGIAATRAIVDAHPEVNVLVLTTYDTAADIARALDAGAAGYLVKDSEPQRLYRAILDAANGETVLGSSMARGAIRSLRGDTAGELSARELEIVRLVARGRSNADIARELFISEATVKTHVGHVLTKLGVETRAAAVARAIELRLVVPGR